MNNRASKTDSPTKAFLAQLENKIAEHPALSHSFLRRFASEQLSREHLIDFAIQHYMYSRFFVRNVAAVVSNVPDERVRSLLIENMYEEVGEPLKPRDRVYDLLMEIGLITSAQLVEALTAVGSQGDVTAYLVDRGIVRHEVANTIAQSRTAQLLELTHPALFRRFLRSLDVSPEMVSMVDPLSETSHFISEFKAVCRDGHWLEALGALGPGTESVVPRIYGAILSGIKRSETLRPNDYVFWTVHVHCDEGHGANIMLALEPYLDRSENRQLVMKGVDRILNARKLWYDGLERMVFRPRRLARGVSHGTL